MPGRPSPPSKPMRCSNTPHETADRTPDFFKGTGPLLKSISVADNPPPPPPKAPPPPAPKTQPPPPPPKAPPPQNPEPKPPPKRKGKRPPKGKKPQQPRKGKRPPKGKKPQQPRKGKPGQPPIGQRKKGRRIKIKLGLRARGLSQEADTYTDQIGWTSSERILEDIGDVGGLEDDVKHEPETTIHQCSMCGVRMEIPMPKRDRYKVICAYPECGHEDMIGIE